MASKKISQLPSSSLSPSLSGVTALVLSGTTYQATLSTLRQNLVDSGSHTFTGSQTILGNLNVSGSITGQQYIISSSIINVSNYNVNGSSIFGNSLDDTHQFTGSLTVTGSFVINGTSFTAMTSGTSGTSGTAGSSGTSGLMGGIIYMYTTGATPNSGEITFNSGTNRLLIHQVDHYGNNVQDWLLGFDNSNMPEDIGDFVMHLATNHDASCFSYFQIQNLVSGGPYFTFTVIANPALPMHGDLVSTAFYQTGNHGSSGTSGISGSAGTSGTSGSSGLSASYIGNYGGTLNYILGGQSIYVESGKSYTTNQFIIITNDSDAAYAIAKVTYYDISSGLLQFNIIGGGNMNGNVNANHKVNLSGNFAYNGTSGSSGTSGDSGSSGTSGSDGSSGTSGAGGSSGTSGSDGSSGTSGAAGSSGTSGVAGSSGTSGTSGGSGAPGADSIIYTFDNTLTDSNPIVGFARLNNNDRTLVTEAYVSKTSNSGVDSTAWLNSLIASTNTPNKSIITFGRTNDFAYNYARYYVTGLTDATGYVKLSLTYIDHIGTLNTNGANLLLGASRIGDRGTSGTSGTSGAAGSSGTSGTSGAAGSSGTSGTSPVFDSSIYATTGSNNFVGNQTINGSLNIGSVNENLILNIGGGGSTYTFDFNSGAIFYISGAIASNTYNVTNVPTTAQKALTLTFVLQQGTTAYSASAYQFDGGAVSVKWQDATIPSGSANKTDVIGLTAFRSGSTWNILGALTSFG